MAVPYGTVWIELNVLANLTQWTMVDADVSGSDVIIHPGGYISYNLSNKLNDGLKASKYRYFEITLIDSGIIEQYNYQNIVEVFQDIVYSDPNGVKTNSYELTPVVQYGSTYNDQTGEYTMSSDLTMMDLNMDSDTITIRNRTDQVGGNPHDVTVTAVLMYRSNDLTGQIGDIGGGQTPGVITQLQITCDRSNWTIDKITDSVRLTGLFPDDMPPFNILGDSQFRWSVYKKAGYPAAAAIFVDIPNIPSYNIPAMTQVKGVRNGVITVRLTYLGAGEHYGEYVEEDLSIINCDPGEVQLNFGSGADPEVNGFTGTQPTVQMSPHPWYTWYNEDGGIGTPSVKSVEQNITLTRMDSIDGGYFTMARSSGLGKMENVQNGQRVSLYGVWNGLQVLRANANMVDAADSTMNVPATTDIPVTIVNCEHTNILTATKEELTSVDESTTLIIESNPSGAPLNATQDNGNPYSWTIPAALEALSLTGGNIRSPQAILKPRYKFFSGTVTVSVLTNQNEAGIYELISKEIAINIANPEELEIVSSTGSFILSQYGAQLLLQVTNADDSLNFVVAQTTLTGGTVGIGYYSMRNQNVMITAERAGNLNVVFTNTELGITKTVQIINDFTAWLATIEAISSTGSFTIGRYGDSITITLNNAPIGLDMRLNTDTIDGGSVTVSWYSPSPRTFTVEAVAEGKAQVNVVNSDIGLSLPIEFTMDYTEWLATVEVESSSGSFTLNDPVSPIQLLLTNFEDVPMTISQNTVNGGSVKLGSYSTSTHTLTINGQAQGKTNVVFRSNNDVLNDFEKSVEVTMDYTAWLATLELVSTTGSFTIGVGDSAGLRIRQQGSTADIIVSLNIEQSSTDGGSIGTFSDTFVSQAIEGRTPGTVELYITDTQGWGIVMQQEVIVTA